MLNVVLIALGAGLLFTAALSLYQASKITELKQRIGSLEKKG